MKDNFNYGSVLKVTRDDTMKDIEDNFAKMRDCGLNTVVIWPASFFWEEKSENYPFDTGRKILKLAEKYGLKIIMELAGQLTVMEYLPDSLMKPEYHPVKNDGSREYGQSSYGFLNYFHPEVKDIICEHYKKTAEAYRDFDALLGYDIFNETMFRSFDEYTFADFREWLKEKYGDIETLNVAWERTYEDFSQIVFENWKWLSIMGEADYYIYRKAAIARFMKPWYDAIKNTDDKHVIIADNIHSQVAPNSSYSRPHDDYGLRTVVDKLGMSFYPKGVTGILEDALRWEIFDAYYDAAGREGFYISEMQTHIQALFNPTTCVEPHELKLWCTEAYAAGVEALVFWKWRPFDTGLQTMGRGIVNYRGLPTERFYTAKELGEKVFSNGVVTPVRSKVGIVFEPLCDDFQRLYTSSYSVEQNIYLKSIFGAYKAFRANNVRCDIIRMNEIFDYDMVIMTNHVVITDEDMDIIRRYVENGGHVIADGRFGVVDKYAKAYSLIPGGKLNDIIGEIYFDTDNKDSTVNGTLSGCNGRHISDVKDGIVLGTFSDGKAAIVKKTTGKGSFTMLNTEIWYGYSCGKAGADEYALAIAKENGLIQTEADSPLKLRVSENDEYYFLFAFNYTSQKLSADIKLNVGNSYCVSVTVEPNDCEIVKIKKEI